MSATISTLPIWKKGSTPAEWLQELAALAMESPARFGRIVVVYEELNADGLGIKLRTSNYRFSENTLIIGALEVAKADLYDYMVGRR